MEALFLYFGKVALISTLMFCYYLLFLKDKNLHQYNRFYLLATVLISLLLPFLKIDYFTVELRENPYFLFKNLQPLPTKKTTDHGIPAATIFALAFGLVSLILLARFLFGIAQIFKFKRKFPHHNQDGIRLYITDLADAPFSFFRNLFWKKDILPASDLGRQILKHEMIHIEQKHSYDQVFIQIISAIFWFNPAFYFIKKEISLIHEYLADKKSLKNSDTKAFAQMLLATHFSGKVIPGTSPLISSNLKKRLKMLQNPKTKFSYARRVFALPMLFTIVFAFIVKAKNSEIEKKNSTAEKAVFKEKTLAGRDYFKNEKAAADTIVPKKIDSAKDMAISDDGAAETAREALQNAREAAEEEARSAMEEAREAAQEAQKTARESEKTARKTEAFLSSKEFKKTMENARKAAEEGKKTAAEAKKTAEEARIINSEKFHKMMEDARKAAEEGKKAAEKAVAFTNSAEFRNVVRQGKAQPDGSNVVIVNGKNMYSSKTTTVTTTGIDDDDFDSVIINGKPATITELHRLDRSKIVRTSISSKITDGEKYKSIDVTTK